MRSKKDALVRDVSSRHARPPRRRHVRHACVTSVSSSARDVCVAQLVGCPCLRPTRLRNTPTTDIHRTGGVDNALRDKLHDCVGLMGRARDNQDGAPRAELRALAKPDQRDVI